jgi:hypothetical protein
VSPPRRRLLLAASSATTTMPKRHGQLVSLLWIHAALRFGAEGLPGCLAFYSAGMPFQKTASSVSLAAIAKRKPNKVATGGFGGNSKVKHKSSSVQKRLVPSLTQEAIELLKKHGDNVDAASSEYFGGRINDSASTSEGKHIDPFEAHMAAVRSNLVLPIFKSLW